jgi:mannan endo-1,4-beta-mannosidase
MEVEDSRLLDDPQFPGRHRRTMPHNGDAPVKSRRARLTVIIAAAAIATAIVATFVVSSARHPAPAKPSAPRHHGFPTASGSYIGLYARGAPFSYAPVKKFTTVTGFRPDVVVYYSGWNEPFQVGFAKTVANDGAVPLVQMNPTRTSVAAIAAGLYDSYLSSYAKSVRSYHRPVVLSFGHEMNGYWYTWGHRHTSPAVFVAAWRHIVKLFRAQKALNVTWLWTINTIHKMTGVPSPRPWWPGSSYVNWVGIDGYFTNSSSVFASVFGPTIVTVRAMTRDPILITETSATPTASQPAKVADLFAGVRLYGLLGFVWFNSVDKIDWRLTDPAAIAIFRRNAKAHQGTKLCIVVCARRWALGTWHSSAGEGGETRSRY